MKRTRTALIVAALAVCTLVSCTATASGSRPEGASPIDPERSTNRPPDEAWPKADGDAPPAQAPAPVAKEGEPAFGAKATTVEECQQLAQGPWQNVPHGPDPIGRVRDGAVPPLPDGENRPPDRLTEFPDLASYRDPSTLEDPGMVFDAMEAAGFQEGIEARWGEGNAYTAITVIQYRDAAGAQDALTAHLTDLCKRATSASVREGGNGLLLTRDSEAVRTVYVLDDIEVSVFTCGCYWSDLESRKDGITDWGRDVEAKLSGPKPNGDA